MFYAVIPAGGSGTRLWPLSRAGHPKFLHALTGTNRSLLQATFDRLTPVAGADGVYVVTGIGHAAAVARQLSRLPEQNILVEPSPRDSCAAIGLAAAIIARRDPAAIMGSFAADHVIRDPAAFVAAVREAITGAEAGYLMTVGITPTHVETGFGYIECGGPLDAGTAGGPQRQVHSFTEKPPYDEAKRYVESGGYLWNASMFVWRVSTFLAELAQRRPDIHEAVCTIAEAWDTPDRDETMARVWPTIAKIAIDYAVMEGAAADGRVATVPGDFGWTDVGDFRALGTLVPADGNGNVVVDVAVESEPRREIPAPLLLDSSGLVLVPGTDRVVAAIGVQDLIVVDTPDAVLICQRDRAQDVKRLVEALKERGDPSRI